MANRDNTRTLALLRAKPKPKRRASTPRTKSFVQTYTPKPKPSVLKYIDLNQIFATSVKKNHQFDEPFLRIKQGSAIELIAGETVEELFDGRGTTICVEDLTCSTDSNWKEEAQFLRALADLIDASR